ncbi:MAG: hypothetical protein C0412_19030, partial [Flavobacterium sp.]|nr:hypothetical protein [Flavobacterium sp.]
NWFYFIYDLRKLFKKKKYDIVHLNSSNTLIGVFSTLFFYTKPKIVFTFHGLSFLDKNYQADFWVKAFSKLYFKACLLFVDQSVFVCNLNLEHSQKLKLPRSSRVIYNGLDEEELSFLSAKESRMYFSNKCGQDFTNCFLIGSTGRLAYPKNYEFLIINFYRIQKSIPNAKVIIIGDGPNFKKYSKMLKERQLENDFFFVGALKDSYKYIKAFDVFTLPSCFEGLSISLIEALFAEIPILASDVGGNSEIVTKEFCQLFILNDIDDFLTKLHFIKNNINIIVEGNIKQKKNFSLAKMMNEYVDLYKNTIKATN